MKGCILDVDESIQKIQEICNKVNFMTCRDYPIQYGGYFITPEFTIETIYDNKNSCIFYIRTTAPIFALHGCPADTSIIFLSKIRDTANI